MGRGRRGRGRKKERGRLRRAVRDNYNNYNIKSHKYVCITTYQPDTKSNPPNPTTNVSKLFCPLIHEVAAHSWHFDIIAPFINVLTHLLTKRHAIVRIELNLDTRPTYPEKFIRDNVVALSVRLQVVIVTLPLLVCRGHERPSRPFHRRRPRRGWRDASSKISGGWRLYYHPPIRMVNWTAVRPPT